MRAPSGAFSCILIGKEEIMRTQRNRTVLLITTVLLLLCMTCPLPAAQEGTTSNVVAVVNGTVIPRSDFDMEMSQVERKLMQNGQALDSERLAEIKEKVLDSLINRELLFQESHAKGIVVDAQEVSAKVQSLRDRFPSPEEFEAALARMNITLEDLRSQLGKDMTIQKLVDDHISATISVTEKEAEDFYKANPEAFKQPEQVRARHILIKVDENAPDEEKAAARKKIEEIRKKLTAGADFAALAKEESQCPSGNKGGDLGFFRRGQMVKPFEDAAFALEPGKTSDIVETEFGYHLIQPVERKPEGQVPFEDIKDRLIEHLKQEKLQTEVIAYLDRLKAAAKIEKKPLE